MTMDTDKSIDDMNVEQLRKALLHYKEQYTSLHEDYEQLAQHSSEMDAIYEEESRDAKKIKDSLESRVRILTNDLERSQTRHETEKKEWLKMEDTLKSELEALRKESSDLKARVRTLEQKNDDLERAERISTAQLEDVEKKMNETLERCAILENELADKIAAEEHNFRLREEMKYERPRMAVEPLRVEKLGEDAGASSSTTLTNGHTEIIPRLNGTTNGELRVVEGKGFANCVNRIVKDLLVKVDRLEGILTNLRSTTANGHPIAAS